MKARFLKSKKINDLTSRIQENLEAYRSGTFDALDSDDGCFFDTDLDIDETILEAISCTKDDLNEVECCKKMHQALGSISQYLARDERLWVYLTHTVLLSYIRIRWPIPSDNEKAVKHIRAHFFCFGARGIERDNAASRLWWMASLCNRSSNLSLEEALTCFLFQSDVRANIIERPTTSQNVTIFSAVLARLYESYKSDQSLFGREKFRSVMKGLNLKGGVKLLGALPEPIVFRILDECIAEAS